MLGAVRVRCSERRFYDSLWSAYQRQARALLRSVGGPASARGTRASTTLRMRMLLTCHSLALSDIHGCAMCPMMQAVLLLCTLRAIVQLPSNDASSPPPVLRPLHPHTATHHTQRSTKAAPERNGQTQRTREGQCGRGRSHHSGRSDQVHLTSPHRLLRCPTPVHSCAPPHPPCLAA